MDYLLSFAVMPESNEFDPVINSQSPLSEFIRYQGRRGTLIDEHYPDILSSIQQQDCPPGIECHVGGVGYCTYAHKINEIIKIPLDSLSYEELIYKQYPTFYPSDAPAILYKNSQDLYSRNLEDVCTPVPSPESFEYGLIHLMFEKPSEHKPDFTRGARTDYSIDVAINIMLALKFLSDEEFPDLQSLSDISEQIGLSLSYEGLRYGFIALLSEGIEQLVLENKIVDQGKLLDLQMRALSWVEAIDSYEIANGNYTYNFYPNAADRSLNRKPLPRFEMLEFIAEGQLNLLREYQKNMKDLKYFKHKALLKGTRDCILMMEKLIASNASHPQVERIEDSIAEKIRDMEGILPIILHATVVTSRKGAEDGAFPSHSDIDEEVRRLGGKAREGHRRAIAEKVSKGDV